MARRTNLARNADPPERVRGVSSSITLPPLGIALILLVVVGLGSVAIGFGAFWNPVPAGEVSMTDMYSTQRAMRHVEEIAKAPHPMGSAEHKRVQKYVVAELKKLGLDTRIEATSTIQPTRTGQVVAWVENIVAVRRANKPSKVQPAPNRAAVATRKPIVLMAHYDSHATGPGAGDDASGCAAILECLRAVKQDRLMTDVWVVITDGEEVGLLGAKAWFDSKEAKNLGPTIVLNLEARGASGPVYMFETSSGNQRLIELLQQATRNPVASSMMYDLYKMLPNDTDLSVVKRNGWVGMNFAMVGSWQNYHTVLDTPQNLSATSLQHFGQYILPLIRSLSTQDMDEFTAKTGQDAVYFDIAGRWLIYMPQSFIWPISGTCSVLFLLCVLLCAGGNRPVVGLLLALGVLIASVFCATFTMRFMVGMLPSYAPNVPRGMPYASTLLFTFASLGCFAVGAAVFRSIATMSMGRGTVLGTSLVWLLLLLASAYKLPGGTYLAIIPFIALVLSLLCWRVPVLSAVFPPIVFIVWCPFIFGVFQLMGPSILPVIAGICILLGATMAPFTRACRGTAEIFSGACSACALVIFIQFPSFAPTGPSVSSLAYWEDVDLGDGVWLTADERFVPWMNQKDLGSFQDERGANYVPTWPWMVRSSIKKFPVKVAADIGRIRRSGNTWVLTLPPKCRSAVLSCPSGMDAFVVNGQRVSSRDEGMIVTVLAPVDGEISFSRNPGAKSVSLRVHYLVDGLPREAGTRPDGVVASPVDVQSGHAIVTDVSILTFEMRL